jgi:uncharacterized protein
VVETHEMRIPEFVQNPPTRCYICKKFRYEALITIASQHGFTLIADGENADDGKDYRPGSLAARELGVRSPLSEAGLTKDRVRALSSMLGLPHLEQTSPGLSGLPHSLLQHTYTGKTEAN